METGEILSGGLLHCHWKSEPQGRALICFWCFNLSVHTFPEPLPGTDSLQPVSENQQRAEKLSCIVRCQTDSW